MNKQENRFCVYLHIRPDTNQVFYVGIGVKKRPHSKLERNKHWNNIVAKNCGEFTVGILCESQTWDSVCQMEKALIKYFGRINNGTGILCNQTDGGDGVVGIINSFEALRNYKEAAFKRWRNPDYGKMMRAALSTPESIAKRSKGLKGRKLSPERREQCRNSSTGRPCSEETRKKLSESNKGKVRSVETRAKCSAWQIGRVMPLEAVKNQVVSSLTRRGWYIEQLCIKSGQTLGIYPTIADASLSTGLSASRISEVSKSQNASNIGGGYLWRRGYDKETLERLIADYSLPPKKVAA